MCDSEILYDRCRSTRTTSAAVKIVAVVLSGQVALNKQGCRPTARSRANRQPAIALLLKRVALITCYNLDGFNYWLDQQKQHYAGSSNFFFSLFAFVARGPQQSHPSAVFFLLCVCASVTSYLSEVYRDFNKQPFHSMYLLESFVIFDTVHAVCRCRFILFYISAVVRRVFLVFVVDRLWP